MFIPNIAGGWMMAFTFHSCSGRRGPPLVDAVRCSCESDPVVRSCPLNRLSPAKNHASQLGHVKRRAARLFLQTASGSTIIKVNTRKTTIKEIPPEDPPDSKRGISPINGLLSFIYDSRSL